MGNKIKRPAGAHIKSRFMPINLIPNKLRWQTCKQVALFNKSMLHMLDEKNVNSLTECKYGAHLAHLSRVTSKSSGVYIGESVFDSLCCQPAGLYDPHYLRILYMGV